MITTKRSLALLLGALVLVLGWFAGSCGTADPAAAQNPPAVCSNTTLNGTYGDQEQGTVVEQVPDFPPPPFPAVLSAIVTFDGAGNVSATYTASFAGALMSSTATGTYTVHPDCTYSAETTDSSTGLSFQHAGTITGQGMLQELNFTYSSGPVVGIGTAKKMAPSPCSLETLKGTFGNLELGSVPAASAFLALSATATYDGKGNLSGTATLNNNGAVVTAPYTATYEVNPDCTYSDVITFGGQTSQRAGTITGEGTDQEVQVIYTDAGIVASGILKKQ